jgi:hypothetical protein
MKRTRDSAAPQRTNALSRQLEDELIVYDLETHQAHSLNQPPRQFGGVVMARLPSHT